MEQQRTAYANEASRSAGLLPKSSEDLQKGHWSGRGTGGDRRASQAAYPLSLPPSLCLSPQLQQLGGGRELIMEAVKPSHSLVSLSNEVSAIKAL